MIVSEPVIRMENIIKRYYIGKPNELQILNGISLSVDQGEFVSIVGESGSGKSVGMLTLMGLLASNGRVEEGEILFDGENISPPHTKDRKEKRAYEKKMQQIRGNRIGMIFQDHHLLMDRTVFDNVAIPLIIAGASYDDIRRRVSAALDKVGLLDKAKNFPIQLSGGEQQRVGIARAVVNKPAVLLADEPTGNLDDALSEGILRLFEEFNRVGVTVLMATHDIGLISRRSYRMLTLSDGHLHGGHGEQA